MSLECLEQRHLLAGLPLGAMPNDTAEFFLGKVVVTPVFIESTGNADESTEQWDEAEISSTLAKVVDGLEWWSDALDELNTVHELEFIVDDLYASTPYQSPYEPINRPSDHFTIWAARFFEDVGYVDSGSFEQGIRDFNHDQRLKHDADWAFTIFVVDSSNDADGQFASGTFATAFALPGGLFFISPSTRPASTFAHETGHIFYAMDEYSGGASYAARRGYYDTQNLNAANNPSPGFVQEPSIMSGGTVLQAAYNNHTSAASTLAMVGWQDSDGDGVFDVLDVPLQLDGSGRFNEAAEVYRFVGEASAQALPNLNRTGLQNDITLNEISRVEYRIDDGPWQTIAEPLTPIADLDLSIPVDPSFSQIQIRAIDQDTGITSNIFTGSPAVPARVGQENGVYGYVWLDRDDNEALDASDPGLSGFEVRVLDSQQQPVNLMDRLEPDDFPGRITLPSGLTLTAEGAHLRNEVFVGVSDFASTGNFVFQASNAQTFQFSTSWSSSNNQVFRADLASPVRFVSIDATGLMETSFGRLEAYDSAGDLIKRVTVPMSLGESKSLTIEVDGLQIDSIRAFGHANTSVTLDNLQFGTVTQTQTDAEGTFHLRGLPDGSYKLAVQSTNPTLYDVQDSVHDIEVEGGNLAQPAAIRVLQNSSVWQNAAWPSDVDNSETLAPLDALLIINELNRSGGSRALTTADVGGHFYDVNGSETISPVDALVVLNELNDQLAGADSELFVVNSSQVESFADPMVSVGLEPTGEAVPIDWFSRKQDEMVRFKATDQIFGQIGSLVQPKHETAIPIAASTMVPRLQRWTANSFDDQQLLQFAQPEQVIKLDAISSLKSEYSLQSDDRALTLMELK